MIDCFVVTKLNQILSNKQIIRPQKCLINKLMILSLVPERQTYLRSYYVTENMCLTSAFEVNHCNGVYALIFYIPDLEIVGIKTTKIESVTSKQRDLKKVI